VAEFCEHSNKYFGTMYGQGPPQQPNCLRHELPSSALILSKSLNVHPNELILNLQEPPERRRLRKNLPIDLPTRFNM
jgi:hypothetical protein